MKDVIFEKTYRGLYVKVTAVDAKTGHEASVFGPAQKGADTALERLALKKLEAILRKHI